MATYLKRSSKLFERLAGSVNASGSSGNSRSGGRTTTRGSSRETAEPSLRELICPVCRTILREPVTLPCTHNLCLRCLRGTVEHNSLSCPLCRQRVGSWLRSATKTETLVNEQLWQLIRKRFPEELELAAGPSTAEGSDLDLDSVFATKKILSAAGEIRREYEAQLQIAEEEMRRQREKERLASEALIRKIQEEEQQEKLVQLAQDQLLAKTLARKEIIDKTNHKHDRSSKTSTVVNVDKSEHDVNQSKSTTNQKMLIKSKDVTEGRKTSKTKSERYTANSKSSSKNVQQESSETLSSQKPVPIHNAVTHVVTHQSRLNKSNNTIYSDTLGDLIGTTSKIYGLQSKEELQVPGDVLSSKKKKLGVEVCVTTVEGEERIGSAESAGSHDSINQEIHHFKPIKALPRTPLRITLDGRQIDPKLIRVLPILKRVSNAVPKPPTPTHLKKIFGCSWSAFKRISRQQVLLKDSSNDHQLETKKTDKKYIEQTSRTAKSNKSQQDSEENKPEVAFDSNKNYTKNINKVINGTKVNKKLHLADHQINNSRKPSKRAGKLKNGLLPGKHKMQSQTDKLQETIEIMQIDDDDIQFDLSLSDIQISDPLSNSPKREPRPLSPVEEIIMENIAERIKRRKNAQTNDVQSAINQVVSTQRSQKSKGKKTSTKGRKPKAKESKSKLKTKVKAKKETKTTTITSQIKRLAARSSKRPRYSEDSESEQEVVDQEDTEIDQQQIELPPHEVINYERLEPVVSPSSSPPPAKKRRKKASKPQKTKKHKKETKSQENSRETPETLANVKETDELVPAIETEVIDDDIITEQQRLEQLAAQERQDRELALMLQESLNGVAGRTRRGVARIPSPLQTEVLQEESGYNARKQKRAK